MANTAVSNVAVGFHNIHSIITRGLNVSIEGTQAAQQQGFADGTRREGFFNYIRALSSVLHAHHLTEDEIAFPYYRDKLPDVAFDRLTYFHQVMMRVLDEINKAAEKCAKNGTPGSELSTLEGPLVRLNEMWHPHIQIETIAFISKADALITVEEQLKLVQQMAEHGLKIAVPHPLTVPFMLYNLPGEDRAVFSQGMPVEVLQKFVPVTWKEQWQSMTPYLLP
jgi:hemerythrin-like domain-containing protein